MGQQRHRQTKQHQARSQSIDIEHVEHTPTRHHPATKPWLPARALERQRSGARPIYTYNTTRHHRGGRAHARHTRAQHTRLAPPSPSARARAHAGYNPRRGQRGCVARSCFVIVVRWRRIPCRQWCSSAVGKPASPMRNAKRSHAPPGAIPWLCAPRAARRPCAVSGLRQLAASN